MKFHGEDFIFLGWLDRRTRGYWSRGTSVTCQISYLIGHSKIILVNWTHGTKFRARKRLARIEWIFIIIPRRLTHWIFIVGDLPCFQLIGPRCCVIKTDGNQAYDHHHEGETLCHVRRRRRRGRRRTQDAVAWSCLLCSIRMEISFVKSTTFVRFDNVRPKRPRGIRASFPLLLQSSLMMLLLDQRIVPITLSNDLNDVVEIW